MTLLSFFELAGQNEVAKDSIVIRQIERKIVDYPEFLFKNGESAFYLVMVKKRGKEKFDISILNDSRHEIKVFFEQKLEKIEFGKCLKNKRPWFIPIFFLKFGDDQGREEEYLKIKSRVFELFVKEEKITQIVKLVRPILIIKGSEIRIKEK